MTFSPTRIAELRADLEDLRSNPRLGTFVRDEIAVVERALAGLEQEGAADAKALADARAQFDEALSLAKKRYSDAIQFDVHHFKKH